MGVEEELLVVDPRTSSVTSRAGEVLREHSDRAEDGPHRASDDLAEQVVDVARRVGAQLELVAEQLVVELATVVVVVGVLLQHLAGSRRHGGGARVDDQQLLLDAHGPRLHGRAVPKAALIRPPSRSAWTSPK